MHLIRYAYMTCHVFECVFIHVYNFVITPGFRVMFDKSFEFSKKAQFLGIHALGELASLSFQHRVV